MKQAVFNKGGFKGKIVTIHKIIGNTAYINILSHIKPIRGYVAKGNKYFPVGFYNLFKTSTPGIYLCKENGWYISKPEFIKLSIKNYYARHHQ